jgi:hypothetical protein
MKLFHRLHCIALPPCVVQLTTSVVSVQPWPLQEFCPLHADDAVLHALVPLHELMPPHFTPAWAEVAKLPAAKIAVAVAIRVLLVICHSLFETPRQTSIHAPSMTPPPITVKSGLGDAA